MEIMNLARKIGTYDISSEPFHDCCPIFMPRMPALHARPKELATAEAGLDIPALVRQGINAAGVERFQFVGGRVENVAVTEDAGQDGAEQEEAEENTRARGAAACSVEAVPD